MSASEASNAQRFIDEKGAAYLRSPVFGVNTNLTVVGERLALNDIEDVVHIVTVIDEAGVEHDLQVGGTVFSGTQAEDEESDATGTN